MKKELFLKAFSLTDGEFCGQREIVEERVGFDALTEIPEGFNPLASGLSLRLNRVKCVPIGFNPTAYCLFLNEAISILGDFSPNITRDINLESLEFINEDFNPIVGGSLILKNLKAVPENFQVKVGKYSENKIKGVLDLSGLKKVARKFKPTVCYGDLDLSSVLEIEDSLLEFESGKFEDSFMPIVKFNLYLNNLKKIPYGFKPEVMGNLYLNSVKEIPAWFNAYVAGTIFFGNLTSVHEDVYKYLKNRNIEISEKNLLRILTEEDLEENVIKLFWKKIKEYDLVKTTLTFQKISEEFIGEFFDDLIYDKEGEKNFLPALFSRRNKFSEDFLRKNFSYYSLPFVLASQELSESFLRQIADFIEDSWWNIVAKNQNLSMDFILDFEDKMDLYTILVNQKVSDSFVEERIEKLKNSFLEKAYREKPKTRVFNFNLPDDFREYLQGKADKNRSTISQEIINLILIDIKSEKTNINQLVDEGER